MKQDPNHLASVLLLYGVSFVWFGVGWLIGMARPEERICRLACAASLASAITLLHNSLLLVFDIHPFFSWFGNVLYFTVSSVHPLHLAIAYQFWRFFLSGSARPRLWHWIQHLLYLWGGFLLIAFKWKDLIVLGDINAAIDSFLYHYRFLKFLGPFHDIYFFSSLLLMALMAARNYRLVTEAEQRRRIKWFTYGTVLGISGLILLQLAELVLGFAGLIHRVSPDTWTRLYSIAKAFTVLSPLALGYAVLKHRVFDIRVVVRMGLQHLLARNFLRVILWLPVVVLIYRLVSNPGQTVAEAVLHNSFYLILFLVALFGLRFHGRMMEIIDRKFFREAYDREKTLMELIAQIKLCSSKTEISRLVSKELDSALHPKSIYVFYRESEKGELTLNYSSGVRMQNLRIADDSRLIAAMEEKGRSAQLPFADESLPPEEENWLKGLGIHLLVPMIGTGHNLFGMLLLGERKAEEPYSLNDRRLLEVVVAEIAMVLENVWLKERIGREQKVQRQVLAQLEGNQMNVLKECPSCGACFDSPTEFCDRDLQRLTLTLPVERVIDGKYRLEQLLGKGGMGAVYEATDLRLGRSVAIKIMMGSMFGDQMALQRFQRESRASARLSHPNIIAVHDSGSIRGEGAYLVMELIRGWTLRKELQQGSPMKPDHVAEVFDQLFEGIKQAHRQGIIHRDLKPENVLVSRNGDNQTVVKVLDFGLAKIRFLDIADPHTLTLPGAVLGTMNYMSPEQLLADQEITERCDIFAMGVMLVECLTGSRPFRGDSSAELVASILHGEFELRGEGGDARELNGVLQKCLAKDPKKRYASVDELQREMHSALLNCPVRLILILPQK